MLRMRFFRVCVHVFVECSQETVILVQTNRKRENAHMGNDWRVRRLGRSASLTLTHWLLILKINPTETVNVCVCVSV